MIVYMLHNNLTKKVIATLISDKSSPKEETLEKLRELGYSIIVSVPRFPTKEETWDIMLRDEVRKDLNLDQSTEWPIIDEEDD